MPYLNSLHRNQSRIRRYPPNKKNASLAGLLPCTNFLPLQTCGSGGVFLCLFGMPYKLIDRYLIAVGRDEAEIILCTEANGKQLKISLFHSRGKCGHQVELSEPKNRMCKNVNFVKAHLDCIQVGFFCPIKGNCLRCRSPPLVLHFLDSKKSRNGGQAYG